MAHLKYLTPEDLAQWYEPYEWEGHIYIRRRHDVTRSLNLEDYRACVGDRMRGQDFRTGDAAADEAAVRAAFAETAHACATHDRKSFGELRYPISLPVRVSCNGDVFEDEIKGLNAGHALHLAKDNWPNCEVEAAGPAQPAAHERRESSRMSVERAERLLETADQQIDECRERCRIGPKSQETRHQKVAELRQLVVEEQQDGMLPGFVGTQVSQGASFAGLCMGPRLKNC